MAIETRALISRRGLLAAVVGGAAAALAGVASRAERAFAAGSDGETVVVGGSYPDVRTATTLSRAVDVGDPILSLGTSNSADANTTELGPSGVVVRFQGSFTGRSVSSLRPGHLRLSAVERFEPDARTDITPDAVTTPRVRAIARDGVAIMGDGPRGGLFGGDQAQIRLRPSKRATHPPTGRSGDLFVDSSGRLWFCRGGSDWARLA
jgi:hypothetical protein